MLNSQKVLAIIPARGGSKGLPGKNIKLLCGKPLISYSIELGLSSRLIDRVVVSTDSQEIAEMAKRAGAGVPFLRPNELSDDLVTDVPVVKHCLNWHKDNKNYIPDMVVFLRPTGPLRTLEETEEAISLLLADPEADSIRSLEEPKKHPYKMWKPEGRYIHPFMKKFENIGELHTGPRQLLPKVFQTTPDIHIFRTSIVDRKDSIIGDKVLPYYLKRPTVDIDSEFDLKIAEYLMGKQ